MLDPREFIKNFVCNETCNGISHIFITNMTQSFPGSLLKSASQETRHAQWPEHALT